MDRREQPLDTSSDARIRQLYRIPVAPKRGKALELRIGAKSTLRGEDWPGGLHELDLSGWDPAAGLPFDDASFDVVVLHRALDGLAEIARGDRRPLSIDGVLSEVARVLSPGGLVIGCVENRLSFDRALARVKRRLGGAGAAASSALPRLSVHQCDRALAAAGFGNVMLFNMLPGIDTPSRILSIERGWSRAACARQLEEYRGLVRPLGHAVWRVLAELGVSQYVGAATFFWGRKAC